jgi:4-amino-4-deoxy-L-arabinose transferase-like glycosyltransferase
MRYVAGIIMVFIVFVLVLLNQTQFLLWDEPVYLSNALSHIEQRFFSEDFRFPLIGYVLSLVLLLFNKSLLSAQLFMIVVSVLCIVVFYLITYWLYEKKVYRYLAVFLFSSSYLFLYWSYRVYPDIPSLFMLLVSIYLFFLYRDSNKMSFIFLSGIATSLAFLFKYPAAISALVIVPFLLINKRFKDFIIYSIGCGIFLIIWVLNNFYKYGHPFYDLFAQKRVIDMYTYYEPISIFLKFFLESYSIILVFIIAFVFYYKFDKFYLNFVVLITILSILYYMLFVDLKLFRYYLMILPFVLMICVSGCEMVFKNYKKIVVAFFIILIVVLQLFTQSYNVYKDVSYENRYYDDNALIKAVEFSLDNFKEGDVVISNYHPWFGYYGNFRARSIWDDNISLVLHEDKKGYLLFYKKWYDEPVDFGFELSYNIPDKYGGEVWIYEVYKE